MDVYAMAGPALAMVSGLALTALGAWVLGIGRRTRAELWFAAFAVLWGLQVTVANALRLWQDPAFARPLYSLFFLLVAGLYVPLFSFIASYPRRRGWLGRGWLGVSLLALPVVFFLLALVFRPHWVFEGVREGGAASNTPSFGTLFVPVATANTVLAFAVALFLVHVFLRSEKGQVARRQLQLVEFGLVPYVAFRGGQVVTTELLALQTFARPGGAVVTASLVAMGVAAAMCAVWVLVDAWPRRNERLVRWLLVLGAAALVVGAVQRMMPRVGLPDIDTVGVWRFIMIGAFAYGVAHFRVADLEVRFGRALPLAAFGFASVVGLEVVIDILGPSINDRPLQAVLITLAFEAALLSLPHWLRRRWPDLVTRARSSAHKQERRLQVYLAAVEAALVDGVVTSREEGILGALRAQLGINDAEHTQVMHEASVALSLGPRPA